MICTTTSPRSTNTHSDCNLPSTTHVKALADTVSKDVKDAGQNVAGVEGRLQSEWVLVDLGDVVVHIMIAPVRALYNLEELWSFKTISEKDAESGNPDS